MDENEKINEAWLFGFMGSEYVLVVKDL